MNKKRQRINLNTVRGSDMPNQMVLQNMEYGSGYLGADGVGMPVMLLRMHGVGEEGVPVTVTVGIPGDGVDQFLVAVQEAVQQFKSKDL